MSKQDTYVLQGCHHSDGTVQVNSLKTCRYSTNRKKDKASELYCRVSRYLISIEQLFGLLTLYSNLIQV